VTYNLGFMIESVVALLLLVTIGYCVVLNRRLKRLKDDEQTLKATISELITATEMAERAVEGLKVTAHECEGTLGARLQAAERFCADLNRQVRAGELILNRLSRIAVAARTPTEASLPAPAPPAPVAKASSDPKAVAAAAQAFADRARGRSNVMAA
jgi:hypothetical protein